MDLIKFVAIVGELLARPFPETEMATETGHGGPGYHVVDLRVSDDFWDDADGTAAQACREEFEAERRELAAALTVRWGVPQRVDLSADLDRSLSGEPLAPAVEHLVDYVGEVDVWHRDGRNVFVGIGQHDRELPMQLVCAVGNPD